MVFSGETMASGATDDPMDRVIDLLLIDLEDEFLPIAEFQCLFSVVASETGLVSLRKCR